jgi:hypothetical protein
LVSAKLDGKMPAKTRARLEDKIAMGRGVAGLGARSDTRRRLFISLPGAGMVDSKLDVPSVAIVGQCCLGAARVACPPSAQ